MIFIEKLKENQIKDLASFIHDIRNNDLFATKIDGKLAKNYISILSSIKKHYLRKDYRVITDNDKIIGYFTIDTMDKNLEIRDIFLNKISNEVLFDIIRVALDESLNKLSEAIHFNLNGFIFDDIIKKYLNEENFLNIANGFFGKKDKKFAIISYKSDFQIENYLKDQGYDVIHSFKSNLLDSHIEDHVDMQIRKISGDVYICSKECYDHYRAYLPNYITLYTTEFESSDKYPRDCILNNFSIDNHLICNPKSVDPVVLKLLKHEKIIMVNQGYSKCSTIVLDDFIITSDKSIYKSCLKQDIKSYLIDGGDISLEGYDTGFIGGTCGYSRELGIVFYGNLEKYKFKDKLTDILEKENVRYYYPNTEKFSDFGSIIFND